tara:strand:- start:3662 stop:4849 length:1188 start_codon:yes stop_codon:yes gene_type:complete
MKKKILLIIRRGILELEYILPIVKKFSKKYEINTIFLNQKSFKSLKNNPYLFNEWNKINRNYYVQKKLDFFIYKAINYILLKINFEIFKNFQNKIISRLHNPKILIKKVKINNIDNLHYIFTEHGNNSLWLKKFYIHENKPRIIFFPSSTQIFLFKKKSNIIDKKKLYGDLLFTISSKEKKFWGQFIEKSKIKPIGVPVFNHIKSISKTKKKLKKTILIAISYRKKLTANDYLKKFMDLFDELLNNKNNYKIIVKPHPFKKDKYLNKLLDLYEKNKKFKVSYEPISDLCKKSDIMICNLLTSAAIYALFNNIPVISFPFRDETNLPSENHQLGFIEKTNSTTEFTKKLNSALYKTDSSVWIKQNKNFKKYYFKNKKTNEQIFDFIENYKYERKYL